MLDFIKSPTSHILGLNLGLIIGNIAGLWNFSSTMFVYIYEVTLLIIISIFLQFTGKRTGANAGTMIISGLVITLVALQATTFIGYEIGELEDWAFLNELDIQLWNFTKLVWPALLFITITLLYDYFNTNRKERELSLQTTLFHKIALVLGVIALSSIFIYSFKGYGKIMVMIIVILVRIALEFYLNPEEMKKIFKKNRA